MRARRAESGPSAHRSCGAAEVNPGARIAGRLVAEGDEMRVVVTGATGFIGRRLVDRLIEAGHTVTALSRDGERARAVLPVRCQVRIWDGRSGVTDLLRGVDAVVHLAGTGVADRRWTSGRKREIHESRVVGSRALVGSMAELPPEQRPKALVAASAIGYYGDRGDEMLTEPGRGASEARRACAARA
jgi:NAD dependent epimerase/dehydratase family enzyme